MWVLTGSPEMSATPLEAHGENPDAGGDRAAPRPRRVLLVDDEPGIVDVFATILREFGFAVEGASDGNVAMDLLGRNSFDVIVSDINMPGCDGLEFLRRVRERDLDVPV